MEEVVIDVKELHISCEAICKAMGYGVVTPSEEILRLTGEILDRVHNIVQARYAYRILGGQCSGDTLVMDSCNLNVGKIIAQQLNAGETFAVFVATAGAQMHELIKELKQKDELVRLFILDTIGSEVAERTADAMEAALGMQIQSTGLKTSNRYSPGYCGWDVAQQHLLFRLLPPEPCGITLSASGLMSPIKSISGIIALGPHVEKRAYQCALCSYEQCYKRRGSDVLIG